MFVNVSPTEQDAGETLCSLNFAARVRGVLLGPARRHVDSGGEVQELRLQLSVMEQKVCTVILLIVFEYQTLLEKLHGG